MKTSAKNKKQTEKLVLLALLTALTAVFGYLGGFISIGSIATINLGLVPVVLGAAILGPAAGAWLGAVSGAILFAPGTLAPWLAISIPGTVITVMAKGILAGLCAGLVYKLLEKFNRYVAVIVSAVVCPAVNTGVFILGCFAFFLDAVNTEATGAGMSVAGYIIIAYVGLNFVFELLVNVLLSPSLLRLVNLKKK